MGAQYLFPIQDRNTRANLCKKYFLYRNHKKWKWSRYNKIFLRCERNQQLHHINKWRHSVIEDLLTYATMLLPPSPIKWKAFRVTKNKTPKLVKMSASINKWSQHFSGTRPQNMYDDHRTTALKFCDSNQ